MSLPVRPPTAQELQRASMEIVGQDSDFSHLPRLAMASLGVIDAQGRVLLNAHQDFTPDGLLKADRVQPIGGDGGGFFAVVSGEFTPGSTVGNAVDTRTGDAYCDLPASPEVGPIFRFVDAFNTFAVHPLEIGRSGNLIEGAEANLVLTDSGTEMEITWVGGDVGWRVLASAAKPVNLTPPSLSGNAVNGAALAIGNGDWTGSPTAFSRKWQRSVQECIVLTIKKTDSSYGSLFYGGAYIDLTVDGSDAYWTMNGTDSALFTAGDNTAGATALAALLGAQAAPATATASGTNVIITGWDFGYGTIFVDDSGFAAAVNRDTGPYNTWTDIGGATGASYVLTTDDVGCLVRGGVAATNGAGTSAYKFSEPSAVVGQSGFPPGALAFWKLDGLSDSSGNGWTLINNNGVNFVTGGPDGGLCADYSAGAASAWLSINEDLRTLAGQTFSLAFFMKATASITPFGCSDAGVRSGSFFVYQPLTLMGAALDQNPGNDTLVPFPDGFNCEDNAWHHYAFVFDAGTFRAYIDGTYIGSTSYGTFQSSGSDKTAIGRNPGGLGEDCAGYFQKVGFWPTALSDADVALLASGATP